MRFPELLNGPSRFAHWPRCSCALVLTLLALMMAWGFAQPPSRSDLIGRPVLGIMVGGAHATKAFDPAGDDIELYKAMAEHVRHGEDYYDATAQLLRHNDYPLRPFFTFRLPTLTWFLALVPHGVVLGIMALLLGATILAWTVRLAPAMKSAEACSWAALFIMMDGLTAFSPSLYVFHEGWAALLIALSLGLYREDRWGPSVALALLALLIRELALPYVLMMGAFALAQHRRRECLAWLAVVLVFAVALALHAQAVWAVTSAADPASPGWASIGGLRFVDAAIQKSTLLSRLPIAVTPVLLPLALLGWSAWSSSTGTRAFLYLAGFTIALMLFGRPDNFYWAAMITPLLFVGLLFAPIALRDLIGGLTRRPVLA